MTLNILCDSKFYDEFYNNKSIRLTDCGFDLFCPRDMVISANSISNKINLEIKCALLRPEGVSMGYKLYPRSSMGSKTPLRLSNSVGIIDPDYRGFLMAIVDNNSNKDYAIKKGDRLFQIVTFDGNAINCKFVESLNDTERGVNGLGSTGR